MAPYTHRYQIEGEFDDVVADVEEALAEEGFGVLSDIDVRATLKQKLDEEFRDYRILGACNPQLAHQALSEEVELGALLPCNVIVYGEGERSVGVSTVDPAALLSVTDNPDLEDIADEVGERLAAAMERVPGATQIVESAGE